MLVDYNLPSSKINKRIRKISASLLAANFGNLAEEAQIVEAAGADSLHMDVVDGHFACNFAFGTDAVIAIRRVVHIPVVVHLEIEHPDEFIEPFACAGADEIIFHPSTSQNPIETIQKIRDLGKQPSVALELTKDAHSIKLLFPYISSVLVLAVPPGFGGVSMSPTVYDKISQIRELVLAHNPSCEIKIDGGVNLTNAAQLAKVGATEFVCGSYIFGGNRFERILALRKLLDDCVGR